MYGCADRLSRTPSSPVLSLLHLLNYLGELLITIPHRPSLLKSPKKHDIRGCLFRGPGAHSLGLSVRSGSRISNANSISPNLCSLVDRVSMELFGFSGPDYCYFCLTQVDEHRLCVPLLNRLVFLGFGTPHIYHGYLKKQDRT